MKRLVCSLACLIAFGHCAAGQEYLIQGATLVPVTHSQPYVSIVSAPVQQFTRVVSPSTSELPLRPVNYQPGMLQHREELPHYDGFTDGRRGAPFHADRPASYGGSRCRDKSCNDDDCCRCRALYLQCCYGNGTFVLRCDDTGHASYRRQGCICSVELRKIDQDPVFAYYAEVNTNIKWAFTRDSNWYRRSIWINCKDNPLAGDWSHFCSADTKKSFCQ